MSGLKGFKRQNLKDIKKLNLKQRKRKKTKLSNVNHHLTHIVSINSNTVILPGTSSRSGVEGELNQGFSCYKNPSAQADMQWQVDGDKTERNETRYLFSGELKLDCCFCQAGKDVVTELTENLI